MHVIMMKRKKSGQMSGCDKIVLNKTYIHTYTDEMDSGHTRSISVSSNSQYVLDHHSMWIKKYAALFEAFRQQTKHRLLEKKK